MAKGKSTMLHGCLHEDATWEKQACFKVGAWLRSNLVYGLNGVRPMAREQKWLACWHLAQSRQRLCLTASWPLVNWRVSLAMETNVHPMSERVVRPFTSIEWPRLATKRRGELPRWSGAIPDDAAVPLAAGRKRRG